MIINYQSFLDFHVLQVTLYKKKLKFNWILFFHEYNQVLLWQVPSKTTSLIVNGLVTNGLKHPPGTPECPQKISAHSVQPFGRLLVTYIYTNVLFYYIDYYKSMVRKVLKSFHSRKFSTELEIQGALRPSF